MTEGLLFQPEQGCRRHVGLVATVAPCKHVDFLCRLLDSEVELEGGMIRIEYFTAV